MDIRCPHCSRYDLAQSVPALHADGVSTTHVTQRYSGVGLSHSGMVPVVGTATVEGTRSTCLAQSLAPAPVPRPAGKLTIVGILLLVPALILLIPFSAPVVIEGAEVPRWAALVIALAVVGTFATPGVLVLAAAARRSRHNGKILRGVGPAKHIWNAAYYCHRCGVAYWPMPPTPSIAAQHAFTPDHFRKLVWQAGGYLEAQAFLPNNR